LLIFEESGKLACLDSVPGLLPVYHRPTGIETNPRIAASNRQEWNYDLWQSGKDDRGH